MAAESRGRSIGYKPEDFLVGIGCEEYSSRKRRTALTYLPGGIKEKCLGDSSSEPVMNTFQWAKANVQIPGCLG